MTLISLTDWHCLHYCIPLLTCSLPSVPIPSPGALPPNRGLMVSLSTPPSPPSGDSSTVPTWFMVAWGLEITVEFFMFSAVVTGACLLGFPPNNLRTSREGRKGENWDQSAQRRKEIEKIMSFHYLSWKSHNQLIKGRSMPEEESDIWISIEKNTNSVHLLWPNQSVYIYKFCNACHT